MNKGKKNMKLTFSVLIIIGVLLLAIGIYSITLAVTRSAIWQIIMAAIFIISGIIGFIVDSKDKRKSESFNDPKDNSLDSSEDITENKEENK